MGKLSEYQAAPLSEIEGEAVIVAHASFEQATNDDGKPYTRTIITLDDGRMYRTASRPIADTLARVPDDGFPLGPVVFETLPSKKRGYQPFWIVRDAVETN